MKKNIGVFFAIVIFVFPKIVLAQTGMVCIYTNGTSSLMYFQNEDGNSGIRTNPKYTTDVYDSYWNYDDEDYYTIENISDDGFENCPLYAGISEELSATLFSDVEHISDDSENCYDIGAPGTTICLGYELYFYSGMALDKLLEKKPVTKPEINQNQYVEKIDYSSLCENRNIKQTMKLIGYLVQVARWIVPLIIIVLGMIDFGKASIESDDKALNKATASLIRRIVAGVVVFFIPTIVLGLLNAIEITKGIEDETNSQFGACTKCIFGAHKNGYCDIPDE